MKLCVNSYFVLSQFDLAKKLSRGHVVDIYVAWAEICKNKNCNFRVLRGILEGFIIKKKLFKIKNIKGRSPLFFDWSIFGAEKRKKRKNANLRIKRR